MIDVSSTNKDFTISGSSFFNTTSVKYLFKIVTSGSYTFSVKKNCFFDVNCSTCIFYNSIKSEFNMNSFFKCNSTVIKQYGKLDLSMKNVNCSFNYNQFMYLEADITTPNNVIKYVSFGYNNLNYSPNEGLLNCYKYKYLELNSIAFINNTSPKYLFYIGAPIDETKGNKAFVISCYFVNNLCSSLFTINSDIVELNFIKCFADTEISQYTGKAIQYINCTSEYKFDLNNVNKWIFSNITSVDTPLETYEYVCNIPALFEWPTPTEEIPETSIEQITSTEPSFSTESTIFIESTISIDQIISVNPNISSKPIISNEPTKYTDEKTTNDVSSSTSDIVPEQETNSDFKTDEATNDRSINETITEIIAFTVTPTNEYHQTKNNRKLIIGVVSALMIVIIIAVIGVLIFLRYNKKQRYRYSNSLSVPDSLDGMKSNSSIVTSSIPTRSIEIDPFLSTDGNKNVIDYSLII
ncbi:hypothetical protein TRFO_15928 [Tritrichomonas foetus]|uniref:Uncharacterized protein n=1 Tax=Tritrichomonas foetus TaxID=1144522 RepID=A0A1J4KWB3_9EUKA|nr:hypothetical protein TRFO_15928 [Tritrichomonas foetus]|eukprot:OHT13813.1 hypothetical protein TRFO_15928 [Tritrichomonas foetus]